MKKHPGFTLIELVVVLIFIGVLAVSVVPRFFDASGTSEFLYRDQALNILRRVQMQAMQCTNCGSPSIIVQNDRIFTSTNVCLNDATHLCIAPQDSDAITIKKTGFNVYLNFGSNGRPLSNCATGNCKIIIDGAVTLPICIEAEGYIHPC